MCPVNSEVWSLGKVMARKINSAILCEWPIIDLQTLIRLARACGGGRGQRRQKPWDPPGSDIDVQEEDGGAIEENHQGSQNQKDLPISPNNQTPSNTRTSTSSLFASLSMAPVTL